jgi:hypothetical protein
MRNLRSIGIDLEPYIRKGLKKQSKEVFMPLLHLPGEAQMDSGEALVKVGGVLRKVHFLAMVLPPSDARPLTHYLQDGSLLCFGAPNVVKLARFP